jgi:hypothetical protein
MLGSGQVLSFYDAYIKLSGREREPFLYSLLRLMDKKTLSEQWVYCEAIRKPEAWFLPAPVNAQTPEPEKTLDALSRMGTLPLKREALEELERHYVLPEGLWFLFRSASTYAEGAAKLESWKTQGLLLPKDSYAFMFENLRLDEYERTARVRCLGHAPAVLEKIAFLVGALSVFPKPPNEAQEVSSVFDFVLERLNRLKEQKITSEDTRFIQKASALFAQRREIQRLWWFRYAVVLGGGVVGGWLFNLARTLVKTPGQIFFGYCVVVGGGGLLWNILDKRFHLREMFGAEDVEKKLKTDKKKPKPRFFGGGNVVVPLVVLASYMASGAFPLLLPEYFLRLVSWVLGAAPAVLILYTAGGFFLTNNTKSILKACEDYRAGALSGK